MTMRLLASFCLEVVAAQLRAAVVPLVWEIAGKIEAERYVV